MMRDELDRRNIKYIPEYNAGGHWHVDIFISSANLAIECDGSYWHGKGQKDMGRDKRKDDFLASKGIRIVRLPEESIRKSPIDCGEIIVQTIHLSTPHEA